MNKAKHNADIKYRLLLLSEVEIQMRIRATVRYEAICFICYAYNDVCATDGYEHTGAMKDSLPELYEAIIWHMKQTKTTFAIDATNNLKYIKATIFKGKMESTGKMRKLSDNNIYRLKIIRDVRNKLKSKLKK